MANDPKTPAKLPALAKLTDAEIKAWSKIPNDFTLTLSKAAVADLFNALLHAGRTPLDAASMSASLMRRKTNPDEWRQKLDRLTVNASKGQNSLVAFLKKVIAENSGDSPDA